MSFLDDLGSAAKGIIAAVAPTAATVLGGPLAGMAAQKIIGALGLAADSTSIQIDAALVAATPEQLLELKKVESSLLRDLRSLDIDLAKLQLDNTKDARQREVITKDWTPRLLAGLVFGLYIGVTYFIFGGYGLDDSMKDIALRSLGTLDAAVGLVLGYYFGSSLGSSNKDSQISSLAGKIK